MKILTTLSSGSLLVVVIANRSTLFVSAAAVDGMHCAQTLLKIECEDARGHRWMITDVV